MLRATTPTDTNPTRSGTPTFGVGMDIPSPSPEPTGEDRPMGGSAATGSDPRVPADIAVESGDADGGSSSPKTPNRVAQAIAKATSVKNAGNIGKARDKQFAAKVVKAKRAEHANSQAQNPMQKWAGLMRHIFLIHIITMVTEKISVIDDETEQVEEEEKEVKKITNKEVSISEMWKITKFVSIKDASWWIRHNVDGSLYDATKSSAVYGLPYGAAKALIPALRMVVCDLMGGEIKEIKVTKEDGTEEITFQGVVPRTTEKFADIYKNKVHDEYYKLYVTLLDEGFVVEPPMSPAEVYALDGNFQALKNQAGLDDSVGKVSTKQLGLLADYLVSLVGAISTERPENKDIIAFTQAYDSYDSCTDVFSVVMFAARQTRKTMGIEEDNCAMDIDENSQPMDGDTYIPTSSKKATGKRPKKNIVDDEAMPALVFDANGNPMAAEKPTPWHLKDKKFVKAFQKWADGKEIWDIAAEVHKNGRKMNKDHLTEAQKKAYAQYRAEVDRTRNAAKAAEIKAAVEKGKEDAKRVEELQTRIQTLEEQIAQVSVAPVEGAAGGAFPMAIPVQGGAMAKLREKIAELEKALETAMEELQESNEALGGTRLTLEMAEKKYEDYVEEKIVDMREIVHTAADNQMELEEALENAQDALENAQDRAWELHVELGSTKTELQKMTKQYEESKKKADQLASEMARYLEATGPKKRTASDAFGEASVPAEASAEAAAPQGGSPAAAAVRRSVRPRRS